MKIINAMYESALSKKSIYNSAYSALLRKVWNIAPVIETIEQRG
jgi:hypothetical protein